MSDNARATKLSSLWYVPIHCHSIYIELEVLTHSSFRADNYREPSPMPSEASTHPTPNTRTSLPPSTSARLDDFLAKCNNWHLLEDSGSLPGRIWITYTLHRGMQQIQKWIEIIEEQISTGLELLRMAGNILDDEEVDSLSGEGCRELWRETQQATLEIHWVLATLQVRLDQVRSGRALVHPHAFRPAPPQL